MLSLRINQSIPDERAPYRIGCRTYQPARCLELNREGGIDRTVLVQGYGPYAFDNSYAADCAAARRDQFAAVCIVDQDAADAPDKLTYWVKERGVQGLRLFTIEEPRQRSTTRARSLYGNAPPNSRFRYAS